MMLFAVDGRLFLSTPSARRATAAGPGRLLPHGDFYPRPPRGGRQGQQIINRSRLEFLSTPSARRATCASSALAFMLHIFLSTPSARRATATVKDLALELVEFLSTPSARRATLDFDVLIGTDAISIHALREEGDEVFILPKMRVSYFYPRPPRGGRPPFFSDFV